MKQLKVYKTNNPSAISTEVYIYNTIIHTTGQQVYLMTLTPITVQPISNSFDLHLQPTT